MYKNVWELLINYGSGWESEIIEDTRSDILQRQREYRENCPEYPTRIRRIRERV